MYQPWPKRKKKGRSAPRPYTVYMCRPNHYYYYYIVKYTIITVFENNIGGTKMLNTYFMLCIIAIFF